MRRLSAVMLVPTTAVLLAPVAHADNKRLNDAVSRLAIRSIEVADTRQAHLDGRPSS
jgi:hypothetical protein